MHCKVRRIEAGLAEALETLDGDVAFEWKMDGARIQLEQGPDGRIDPLGGDDPEPTAEPEADAGAAPDGPDEGAPVVPPGARRRDRAPAAVAGGDPGWPRPIGT